MRLLLQLGQFLRAYLLQLLLACQNIHRQLLKIRQIHLIHPVQHIDILHQLNLVVFQHFYNLIDIRLYFIVFYLHHGKLAFALFKKSKQPFGFFACIKAFQLRHKPGDHISDLAHIFGAHIIQRTLRKIRQLFLRADAVMQNGAGIAQVNLLCKGIYLLAFFLCQHRFI